LRGFLKRLKNSLSFKQRNSNLKVEYLVCQRSYSCVYKCALGLSIHELRLALRSFGRFFEQCGLRESPRFSVLTQN
jgi:hypothetical protein